MVDEGRTGKERLLRGDGSHLVGLPVRPEEVLERSDVLPPSHKKKALTAFSERPQNFAGDEALRVRDARPHFGFDIVDQRIDLTGLDRRLPHANNHAHIIPDHGPARNAGAVTIGTDPASTGNSQGVGSVEGLGSTDVVEGDVDDVVSRDAQRWSGIGV